jgi:lysophospholipase L1-like esterase
MELIDMLRILFITLITFCFAQTASAQGRNILVFGDSNSWGWAPVLAGAPTTRYPAQSRWPNVMAKTLGAKATVTIDALSGRTVDQDLPSAVGVLPSGDFNGRRAFPASLARELPLDMVIIMLGTNDLRSDIGRTQVKLLSPCVLWLMTLHGFRAAL